MSHLSEMSVFGKFADWRAKPIPLQTEMRKLKAGFRQMPINKAGAAFSEPLQEAKAFEVAGENFYYSQHNPPYWQRIEGAIAQLYLRHGIGLRLAALNQSLRPVGLELFLLDSFRPRAVQAYFHDVWMPAQLRRRQPDLEGVALRQAVEIYWSAPTQDPASPAPHETGAALDLTLRWIGGEALWMGSLFDDVSRLAHRDHFEVIEPIGFSDEEACKNRRLLHWLMAEQGFVGHPDEWWHFSYGDQLWAALSGAEAAHYGLAEIPATR